MTSAGSPRAAGAAHWDDIYSRRASTDVSWFQSVPTVSLALLEAVGARADASLVDVGAGASTLVDALVERGWSDVTVLDVSDAALAVARERLGKRPGVEWLAQDLLQWTPRRRYAGWHDRAVFHFLTDAADRDRYRSVLRDALDDDGFVLLGACAPGGPDHCSGLPIEHYDADGLAAELGSGFTVVDRRHEEHRTPAGEVQPFTWVAARRTSR